MELKEIWNLILPELVQRSYRLMRENDQDAGKAFKIHQEAMERMKAFIGRSGEEAPKIFEEFCQSMEDVNSFEVEHAYVQGARDCVCLLRGLGIF